MSLRKLYAPALLFSLILLFAPCVLAQEDARSQAAAEIESLRAQITAREAALFSISKEDTTAHALFLAQPGTGLVRLLPREKWDGKLSVHGGGAYYSFTRRTHEYGHGSDISLEQNYLGVGFAGADFGFMLNLGDVPLEMLSLDAEALRFPSSFKTPTLEADARATHLSFYEPGRSEGEFVYKSRLPVSVGSTYVLRSINYDDWDVLVAFRVIKKDSDGSIVLLWKMLEEFPKPNLQRNVAAANGQ
ncbi:MAG TPA: hypothetical protein VGP08_11210 [Pyrinomonadaceae bacterium]|jgi:hypothetical protein|nr:hypothetical protein [Pyrinomonadaceae bacterium]